jgi:hypothetical protein
MGKQFDNVSGRYGAPMGRASFGTPEHAERKIRVFRVNLDGGGYDDGGAYWGHGGALYCATDSADYRQFTRASSRLAAIAEFEIERDKIARPPLREFATWQALAGENLQYLNDRGRPVFLKLKGLGF